MVAGGFCTLLPPSRPSLIPASQLWRSGDVSGCPCRGNNKYVASTANRRSPGALFGSSFRHPTADGVLKTASRLADQPPRTPVPLDGYKLPGRHQSQLAVPSTSSLCSLAIQESFTGLLHRSELLVALCWHLSATHQQTQQLDCFVTQHRSCSTNSVRSDRVFNSSTIQVCSTKYTTWPRPGRLQ